MHGVGQQPAAKNQYATQKVSFQSFEAANVQIMSHSQDAQGGVLSICLSPQLSQQLPDLVYVS